MQSFSRLSVGTRLSALLTLVIATSLGLLALTIYRQSAGDIESQVKAELRSSTQLMQQSVAMYDVTLSEGTQRLGSVFDDMLPAGARELDSASTVTIDQQNTPSLHAGKQALNLNVDAVDRFAKATGGVATIFARTGDDFVRITTSLRNKQDERVIGTLLDRKGKAYAALSQGKSFTGQAQLFGEQYMTHYQPLRDAAGEVIGALFVGRNYTQGLAALKAQVSTTKLGQDGYFVIVDMAPGDHQGQVIAAPPGTPATLAALVPAEQQALLQAVLDGKQPSASLQLRDAKGASQAFEVTAQRYAPWQWAVIGAQPRSAIDGPLDALMGSMLLFSLVVLALCIAVVFIAARKMVTGPLLAVERVLGDVAAGRLDNPIEIDRHDELGRLLLNARTMRDDLRARLERDHLIASEALRVRTALDDVSTNVMIADAERRIIYVNRPLQRMLSEMQDVLRHDLPNFDATALSTTRIDQFHRNPEQSRLLDQLKSTHTAQIEIGGRIVQEVVSPVVAATGERMGYVVEWSDRTQQVQVEQEVALVVEAAAGDLSERIDVRGKHGFLLLLTQQLNTLLDNNADGLSRVSGLLSSLSQGDLTARMDGALQGVFATIRDDANATADQLAGIVRRIKDASLTINSAATEIATGNGDLSRRTEQQAAALEETAASMEELTATVKQNADNADQANRLVLDAAGVAAKGGDVLNRVVTTMADIDASSKKIAEIISVIDGIAFQTNILALNAAVEAARAGEQGRGFAVVASEVRTLAQRSAGAAKEIKHLIEDSVTRIGNGAALASEAGSTMQQVVTSVQRVTDIMGEITSASREQAAGITQVNQTVTQMDETTQQNAALVEEATAAARSMEDQAAQLVDAVAVFRLEPQDRLSTLLANARHAYS
ncbi:Cache 3/Cache 2 fusion domain-containing protein [Xanthomonas citri pv. malvacearum]|uniref:HAMP domain-containing protein n=1 Tax=Xanthomonas campestris pv. malvacearum TaxID=86040 RepID=A0AA44Z0U5_XANCM|nr:Cache 3/Cache 2 fusion domain-containing protein [Xanthomonas citri]ASN01605.1 chemotaxis protein [Xanthomonas citri pv. malvacearum]ASN09266.1 chemotaxis protein [Xanthomonas citri pv. malvacearum]ASY84848.1 methyl-accepting chemotaxis protein [Xanthomonas citri pv. malvacearum]MCC4630230.1 Cache 3/Cache 2 fusion domain-containing protein [Xanthomonas citri]NMI14363.1 HAMP domain-containing protein [Xanthomonas citri]